MHVLLTDVVLQVNMPVQASSLAVAWQKQMPASVLLLPAGGKNGASCTVLGHRAPHATPTRHCEALTARMVEAGCFCAPVDVE